MLHAIVICPDERLGQELAGALSGMPDLEIARVITVYPSADELLRMIRVRKADVLFLDIDDFDQAKALASSLDENIPGFPVVTVAVRESPALLPELMSLGIREHLSSPLAEATLAAAIDRVRKRLTAHPHVTVRLSDLYSFLPAMPGCGATTIAISASCALAENLGARTLLMDCDLAAGAIQFLLKLGSSASLMDAMMHADHMDEDMWTQMLGRRGALEVLHAGRHDPPSNLELVGLQQILSLARAQYEVICADLGSSTDPLNLALMRESRGIFLVTTTEVVSLHMASARLARLVDLGLGERVSLLLGRHSEGGLSPADVEKSLGVPVALSFPNDYAAVQQAILGASPVSTKTALGQSVLTLAQSLAPHLHLKPAPGKRRFLQFFAIPNREDPDLVWHD